jgi:acetyltransferase-like isoleucine patch superfamily enzyme
MQEKLNHGIDFYIHEDVHVAQAKAANFGDHVAIDKGFYCTTQIDVGDYVHIGPYVSIIGGPGSHIVLHDFSFISVGTKIVAGSDDYTESNLMGPLIPEKFKKLILTTIKFEKFSGCGANCTILPGITLAEGSILCAGSLLNKNTKPWTIYAGNPARPIKTRDKEKIIEQENYIRKMETK